jgi:hypothetical protein
MPVEGSVLGTAYREDDWPHGLSCGQCPHVFSEPERYSERLYAFVDDVPLVKIVCLDCATSGEPPTLSEPRA